MEFDLISFTLAPTIEVFNRCRKKDLLLIADFFRIDISKEASKQVIKDELFDKLVNDRILPQKSDDNEGGERFQAVAGKEVDSVSPPDTDAMVLQNPMLAVRLRELDLEIKKQECEAQVIRLRTVEAEAERDIKLRELALEAQRVAAQPVPLPRTKTQSISSPVSTVASPSGVQHSHVSADVHFDPSRYIKLVPPFREAEVDSYFTAFERVAGKLGWPRDMWALLLQCSLTGKAQEVCSSLPIESSLDYDIIKTAVLRVYELVPEAYRQKFRRHEKTARQSYVEFAREKRVLFDKWCLSNKITTLEQLQELILLEDFKDCMSENLVVHLNEQKVACLSNAAILADEFVLTHRTVFLAARQTKFAPPNSTDSLNVASHVMRPTRADNFMRSARKIKSMHTEKRECFYCLSPEHLIADCQSWKQKNSKSKSVALAQTLPKLSPANVESYQPFLLEGMVSIFPDAEFKPVVMLRDTGSAQSFVLEHSLPFSAQTYTGFDVLVRGIEMHCVNVPLHTVHLKSNLVSGAVKLGVRKQLPVEGVDLIIGNDLAGGEVFPTPIVTHTPLQKEQSDLSILYPLAFPACAVTRAQAQNFKEMIDLADSFLVPDSTPLECTLFVEPELKPDPTLESKHSLVGSRKHLVSAQREDPTLTSCVKAADLGKMYNSGVTYFWDDGLLRRRWKPDADDANCQEVQQIVLPVSYRTPVLKLAHEHIMSGHLGVTKTFYRVSRYFYWPGIKSTVSAFCKACNTCQLAGKPNQRIPVAPLNPIPVMSEPFERLVIDCVGPLPKTKAGHQYLVTIMCAATRFPEAIPLRNLKSKAVVKELIKFCSTFGLPKIIQTDRGTNFTSKMFEQILKGLGINHQLSSAYHPESQGVIERFHQTLKTMLRSYCVETGNDWDEGLPFLLFAVRETVQESLGFSPAELVFGHVVRGPLKLLSDRLLEEHPTPMTVPDYVHSLRQKLHRACEVAAQHLVTTQDKMKACYDKKSVKRSFQPGDSVLVLLPIPGSVFQAKFTGPYVVKRKVSDTNYIINTPDRRRKSRVCHINMLKRYVITQSETRGDKCTDEQPCEIVSVPTPTVAMVASYVMEEDGLCNREVQVSSTCLQNSAILSNLKNHLAYLSTSQANELTDVLHEFPSLFSDVPGKTTLCVHDIDVGGASPIKQHPYRINPQKRDIMKAEVEYMLHHGFAVASQSPWSSPCLLVPKPDSSYRFCTDFRKVNNITKADSFPLPRMEDCVDRVGNAKFVTKLDLLKGYWQVPLTQRASEISAFVTPDNFLQYKVLAFGMRNAPATFQRLMCSVLSDVENCEVYLDDVVIHSVTWAEHLSSLKRVLQRLADASLTLNLAKCEFAKGRVTYLGKQVGQGMIKPVEAKITAILEYSSPTNKRELRRFLGMCGYYRAFCPNFSSVVSPLTDLLSTTKRFVWTPSCGHAFNAAKDLLCSTPILKAPQYDAPFQLQTDASATGAGAVLLQEDEFGVEHPVSYFSKKFSRCQQNYSVIEKEALALLMALQHFEVYLGGSMVPIIVYTDHNPLVFLERMSNSNQRLMRWALAINEFTLNIRYKRGSDNIVADALSRS